MNDEFIFEIKEVNEKEIVLFDKKGEVILPPRLVPRRLEAGQELVLTVTTKERHQEKKTQQAKDILNEILK